MRSAILEGRYGFIRTPAQGNNVDDLHAAGVPWCADNGCFGKGYPGDAGWLKWLNSLPRDNCLFAVAPDVVGDGAASLERSAPFFAEIRALGFPAALVVQNGSEHIDLPWDDFDALFLGGVLECLPCGYVRPKDDFQTKRCPYCSLRLAEWKMGAAARDLVRQAKARGKHVHCGRVNGGARLAYMTAIGCDTSDGTFIKFAPDLNLARADAWFDQWCQLDITWFA